MSKRKTLSLRVLKHALLLSGQLWQVCITTSICLVKRNQRKFKVMRTQHLIFITSHLTDHHCTVSVRTNQHRHKMLDILPSRPQDVRTQLAPSRHHHPDLLITSWRGFARNCRLHPVLSPRVSPVLTALLTPRTAPASPGRPGPGHSYILPQHLLRGIQGRG